MKIDENRQVGKRRLRFNRLSQRLGRIVSREAPPAPEKMLVAARAEFLYKNAPVAILANLLAGVVCVAVLVSAKAGNVAALTWAALLLLSAAFFYVVWRGYGEAVQQEAPGPWMKRTALAYGALGAIWAIAIAHLYMQADTRHVSIVFLLAGTSAAMVAAASSNRLAAIAFAAPALIALAAYFIRGPGLVEWMLAGFALAFFGFLVRSVSGAEPQLIEVVNLRDKNRQLVEALEYAVAETRLREDEMRIVTEGGNSWEAWFGVDGRLRWINQGVEPITGYTIQECMGQRNHPFDIIYPPDRDEALRALAAAAKQPKIDSFEFRITHKDGSVRTCIMSSSQVRDQQDRPAGFRVSIRDITDRRALEEEVEITSMTDALTGLINRGRFFELAQEEIFRAAQFDRPAVLAIFDIDRFRALNDRYGNEVGDECLRRLTQAIGEKLNPNDLFGRYGGEEFIVLMPETQVGEALRRCEQLRQAVEQLGIVIGDGSERVMFTVSVGLADFQAEGEDLEGLIARADAALQNAKQSGRNQVAYGDPTIASEASLPGTTTVRPLFGRAAPADGSTPGAETASAEGYQTYSGGIQKSMFSLPKR